MKIILVATDNQEAIQAIKDLFQGEYVIDVACDIKQCLEKFREQRCEYLFIEISFLESMEPQSLEDTQYKIALMKFWHYFPTAQVIVMAYQKDIRKAVMAVRSGASNYITYPIHRDELKHITESVYKALIIKSELSYLRDSIWKGVFINPWKTENKLMIGVFDKLQAVAPMKPLCCLPAIQELVRAHLQNSSIDIVNERMLSLSMSIVEQFRTLLLKVNCLGTKKELSLVQIAENWENLKLPTMVPFFLMK